MPARLSQRLRPARQLCPGSRVSPAYRASVDLISSIQAVRRALCLAGATPHPAGTRPRRSPAAICTLPETQPPPLAIARSLHTPARAPNEGQATLAAAAAPPDIPSRLAAFGGERNSFQQAPGGPARNPDELRAKYQSRPWRAGRSRGQGSTTNPGRRDAARALP